MAVGFILAKKSCDWAEIHNPAFVFTSPNMNQGISAGTRSHVVPEEVDLGLWIEDIGNNVMHRIMSNQTTIEWCSGNNYDTTTTIAYLPFELNHFLTTYKVEENASKIYINSSLNKELSSKYVVDIFNDVSVNEDIWIITNTSHSTISIYDSRLKIAISSIPSSTEEPYCTYKGSIDIGDIVECELFYLDSDFDSTSGPKISLDFNGTTIYVKLSQDHLVIFNGSTITNYSKYSNHIYVKFEVIDSATVVYVSQGNMGYNNKFSFGGLNTSSITAKLSFYGSSITTEGSCLFDNFYITKKDYVDVMLLSAGDYRERFFVESASPVITNWYKLDDNPPTYNDSIGTYNLTASGVNRTYDISNSIYVAEFDDDEDLIKSDDMLPLGTKFAVSFFVDNYGSSCSSNDVFGECRSFLNFYNTDDEYFSVGTTDSNTLYYKLHTVSGTFGTDTGTTLSSGIFNHVCVSCDTDNYLKCYYNGNLISTISGSFGELGDSYLSLGGSDEGVGSKFKGRMADVKVCVSGTWAGNDALTLYGSPIDSEFTPAVYGVGTTGFVAEANDPVFFRFPTYMYDLKSSASLHIIMRFGEAYHCYITAWDDDTHSTTSNHVFLNQSLRLSAAVWRNSDNSTDYPTSELDSTHSQVMYSSVSDMPIRGDDYYFGKFNLIYFAGADNVLGDIISFRPRLAVVTKDQFPPGNYDFVITFHYQYT